MVIDDIELPTVSLGELALPTTARNPAGTQLTCPGAVFEPGNVP